MKIASLSDEIHIRSIEASRKQDAEGQASIERCLGGLNLDDYERPYRHLTSDELWRLSNG